MTSEVHVSATELEAGLPDIEQAPASEGTVELIVRRPAEGEREILEEGELDLDQGLVGDRWRSHARTSDGAADTSTQLTLMNARVIALLAPDRERWGLAGDQLYVDLDLRPENLPPGTRLALGSAVIEVTDVPHTGCAKFTARFGSDAIRFVNSRKGRSLRLRGMNARVVQPGRVRRGDVIRRLAAESEPGVEPPLVGTHWALAELEGVALEIGEHESAPYLVLDRESSRLSGSGGCNRLAGSYELGDDGLRFGPIASTRMACSEAVMEREAAFLAALAAATGHRLDGSSLELLEGDRVRARLVAATAESSQAVQRGGRRLNAR
ncbi:MAG TPA: META domain-containing protein [Gaiellaceae bacterium]|nr:META domain-containing protein [Gaiellaceae bacterium]